MDRPRCTHEGCDNLAKKLGPAKYGKLCNRHYREKYGIPHPMTRKVKEHNPDRGVQRGSSSGAQLSTLKSGAQPSKSSGAQPSTPKRGAQPGAQPKDQDGAQPADTIGAQLDDEDGAQPSGKHGEYPPSWDGPFRIRRDEQDDPLDAPPIVEGIDTVSESDTEVQCDIMSQKRSLYDSMIESLEARGKPVPANLLRLRDRHSG